MNITYNDLVNHAPSAAQNIQRKWGGKAEVSLKEIADANSDSIYILSSLVSDHLALRNWLCSTVSEYFDRYMGGFSEPELAYLVRAQTCLEFWGDASHAIRMDQNREIFREAKERDDKHLRSSSYAALRALRHVLPTNACLIGQTATVLDYLETALLFLFDGREGNRGRVLVEKYHQDLLKGLVALVEQTFVSEQ